MSGWLFKTPGLDRTGQDQIGEDRIGKDGIKQDRTGQDRVRLTGGQYSTVNGMIGLNCTRQDRIGLESTVQGRQGRMVRYWTSCIQTGMTGTRYRTGQRRTVITDRIKKDKSG